jgi:hypothetical protein
VRNTVTSRATRFDSDWWWPENHGPPDYRRWCGAVTASRNKLISPGEPGIGKTMLAAPSAPRATKTRQVRCSRPATETARVMRSTRGLAQSESPERPRFGRRTCQSVIDSCPERAHAFDRHPQRDRSGDGKSPANVRMLPHAKGRCADARRLLSERCSRERER